MVRLTTSSASWSRSTLKQLYKARRHRIREEDAHKARTAQLVIM